MAVHWVNAPCSTGVVNRAMRWVAHCVCTATHSISLVHHARFSTDTTDTTILRRTCGEDDCGFAATAMEIIVPSPWPVASCPCPITVLRSSCPNLAPRAMCPNLAPASRSMPHAPCLMPHAPCPMPMPHTHAPYLMQVPRLDHSAVQHRHHRLPLRIRRQHYSHPSHRRHALGSHPGKEGTCNVR